MTSHAARRVISIGSRGSRLALIQAGWVARELGKLAPELAFTVEVIDSKPVATARSPVLGDGIFVRQIQRALLNDRVSIAVHSLKDLPTAPVEGLEVAAIPARADPREALIGNTLIGLPRAARVGTSSPRRAAQLRHLRADLAVVPLNGNIPSRMRKVASGRYHAAMLAAAGLQRLGIEADEIFPEELVLPAPGQGALAIEVRTLAQEVVELVRPLNHAATASAVAAERGVLRKLGGGCLLPVSAYATVDGEMLVLQARVISPDGRIQIAARSCGPAGQPEEVAAAVASSLLEQGAADVLERANTAPLQPGLSSLPEPGR